MQFWRAGFGCIGRLSGFTALIPRRGCSLHFPLGLQCLYAVDIGNTGLRHRVCERVFVQADREFNPVLRSEAGLSSSYYLLDVVGVLACYHLKMTCPSNTSALSSVGPVFGGSPISGCAGGVGVFVGVGVGSGDGVGFIPYRRLQTVQFSKTRRSNRPRGPLYRRLLQRMTRSQEPTYWAGAGDLP